MRNISYTIFGTSPKSLLFEVSFSCTICFNNVYCEQNALLSAVIRYSCPENKSTTAIPIQSFKFPLSAHLLTPFIEPFEINGVQIIDVSDMLAISAARCVFRGIIVFLI